MLDSIETWPLDSNTIVSWAAYHASLQPSIDSPTTVIGLLPLLMDNALTVALIKQVMTLMRKAGQYLNPGRTPVFVMDQPLYALAKTIQWSWPDPFGEIHCVARQYADIDASVSRPVFPVQHSVPVVVIMRQASQENRPF